MSTQKFADLYMEVADFVILNLLWLAGTILGAIVFGWAPSTVALLTIMRDKIRGTERGSSTVKRFFSLYKKEFKNANHIGIIITILFAMSYINKLNFDAQPEFIFTVLSVISICVMVFLFGICLYVFPLYVHYNIPIKEYITKAAAFLVLRPVVTILLVLWCWLVFSVIHLMPGLIPVFLFSVFFYGNMAITYQFFMRNEDRLKAASEQH